VKIVFLYGDERYEFDGDQIGFLPLVGETVEIPGFPTGEQRTLKVLSLHHLIDENALVTTQVIHLTCGLA